MYSSIANKTSWILNLHHTSYSFGSIWIPLPIIWTNIWRYKDATKTSWFTKRYVFPSYLENFEQWLGFYLWFFCIMHKPFISQHFLLSFLLHYHVFKFTFLTLSSPWIVGSLLHEFGCELVWLGYQYYTYPFFNLGLRFCTIVIIIL